MPRVIIQKSEFEIKFEQEGLKLLEKISNILRSTLGDSTINTLKNATTFGSFLGPERALLQNKQFRNNVANNPIAIAGSASFDRRSLITSVAVATVVEFGKLLGEEILRIIQRTRDEQTIDRSDLGPVQNVQQALDRERELINEARTGIRSLPNKEIADLIFEVIKDSSANLRFEDVLDQIPELKRFFDAERIQEINRELENLKTIQNAAEEAARKLNQTGSDSNKINEEQKKILDENSQGLRDQTDIFNNGGSAVLAYAGNLTTMSDAQNSALKDAVELGDKGIAPLAVEVEDTADQFEVAEKKLEGFNDEAADVDIKDKFSNIPVDTVEPEEVVPQGTVDKIETIGPAVTKSTDEGKKGLTSLGVFAANIATEIAKSFSDFISTALKGDFDGIEDLWDNLLDSLQDAFADFVAGLIANPIRIAFEAMLNGTEGGLGDLLGGLFGGGGGGEKSTTPPKTPALGTEPLNIEEPPEVDPSLLSTLGSVVGTIGKVAGIIGTIVAVVLSIVNIITGLLEKGPKLDLDFDQFRDADGVSIGIAATVADLFDSDTFLNEIFNTSVSRQAGLGLQGGAGKVIQEALAVQIGEIQDIINTLPFELAAQLNEALLSTPVDIESEIKGDRLLEFDETKQENPQNVIKMDNFQEKRDIIRQNDELSQEFKLAA